MISANQSVSALVLACLVAACTPPEETTTPAAVGPGQSPPAGAMDAAAPATSVPPPEGQAVAPGEQAPQVLEGIPSKIAPPPKGVETPSIAPGAEVSYVCESGMPLRVTFDGVLALVAWTDGRRLRLTMTANESGGGERYAGEGFVLTRIANVVELTQQAGGERWRCAEGQATA